MSRKRTEKEIPTSEPPVILNATLYLQIENIHIISAIIPFKGGWKCSCEQFIASRFFKVFRSFGLDRSRGEIMKRIYVGNLPFSASEEQLRALFAQYGNVHSVKLITDRETARPRGFGFVEMESAEADAAIAALNEKAFNGRTLKINEARARTGGPGFRKEGSPASG
jgi:hypothetical protein